MERKKEKNALTRREFAARAGLVGVGATLGATPALAKAVHARATAETGDGEAELRVKMILGMYPGRFSEQQQADLRKMSAGTQKSLDKLRAYKVENGDEPALKLKPLMEREKKVAPAPGVARSNG
jgi:hypothetical protein